MTNLIASTSPGLECIHYHIRLQLLRYTNNRLVQEMLQLFLYYKTNIPHFNTEAADYLSVQKPYVCCIVHY